MLTRKWYAALSGSKISVVPSNKTGAKLEDDGELHVKVNAAYELRLPSGMRLDLLENTLSANDQIQ